VLSKDERNHARIAKKGKKKEYSERDRGKIFSLAEKVQRRKRSSFLGRRKGKQDRPTGLDNMRKWCLLHEWFNEKKKKELTENPRKRYCLFQLPESSPPLWGSRGWGFIRGKQKSVPDKTLS